MIYSKLRKLERQKRDIQSLIIAAYQSSSDPEVVVFRVSELQMDLNDVNDEIQMEEILIGFKWGLAIFVLSSVSLIIYGLILSK
jgi:hypothetical protein